ncbi:hypothetical protein [Caballeronia catudaia]|nr:hypothetical protein [Caballeronia catudaia]
MTPDTPSVTSIAILGVCMHAVLRSSASLLASIDFSSVLSHKQK